MTKDQKNIAAKLDEMIILKGIMKQFIASKFGMTKSRLSRILRGKEPHLSDDVLNRIFAYIDQVNTNDIET